MRDQLLRVDGFGATDQNTMNLRTDAWSIALDQRQFGPRRLIVAFANDDGSMRYVAHAPRTEPPEDALDACIRAFGLGSDVAIAYSDEMIAFGPPPDDLADRYGRARAVAEQYGVRLVDWISCDDELFRSTQMALFPGDPWWDEPDLVTPPGDAA